MTQPSGTIQISGPVCVESTTTPTISQSQVEAATEPQPLNGSEPTIYVGEAPTRKDGSPVFGNFGKGIGRFVTMDVATWKRLCAENPGLQTTVFRVGAI